MPDEHLAVRGAAGADADRGDPEPLGDARRDRGGDRLEHEREAAGSLERLCVLVQANGLLGRAPLSLEAAERGRRLRGQADVPHHRHAGAHDRVDARQHRACTLELDRVGTRLLDEADRVRDGLLVGDLERAEGHVGDDERAVRAARRRARQDEHLLHRGRHRGVVPEHRHRGGVADQDHVGAGAVGESPRRGVVGGDHRDRLPARLHLRELGDRQLAGRRGAVSWGTGAGAHGASPSRGTLSIRRVEPTRTAAARTGGSKGAIST